MNCCLISGSVAGRQGGSKLRAFTHVCAVSALSCNKKTEARLYQKSPCTFELKVNQHILNGCYSKLKHNETERTKSVGYNRIFLLMAQASINRIDSFKGTLLPMILRRTNINCRFWEYHFCNISLRIVSKGGNFQGPEVQRWNSFKRVISSVLLRPISAL